MDNHSQGTTLGREKKEQLKWRPRPGNKVQVFDHLLKNEFLPLPEIRKMQQNLLHLVLKFSAVEVPYYEQLFKKLNMRRFEDDLLEIFQEIPVLDKEEVQQYSRELLARRLPKGEAAGRLSKTSGTTGHPVTVLHSIRSGNFFRILKQREFRWFRFNPKRILSAIRSSKDLPPGPGGKPIKLGETSYLPYWYAVGQIFETGPFFGFMWTNPLESQIEWLSRTDPAYLLGQSADLEHLSLAYTGHNKPASLKGIFAIAQDLTEEMEQRISSTFNIPVYVNYGLNEIGIVATRCPEGGRYHVHPEHCFVEIVDDKGKVCNPGEKGRIVVTSLNNLVMPLIRYDTDDLAEVTEGPCPCGRTLPSFGSIQGRYRRLAALPPGTMNFFSAVCGGIDDMPDQLLKNIRQYQLHQFKDGSFELRIVTAATLKPQLVETVLEKWNKVETAEYHPLDIKEVKEIHRPQGGKFQKFTSDFMPLQQD